MEPRKQVIVGIDPGTTTAYAVLDMDGNLMGLNSSKNMGLSELINEVIKFGRVAVVGTDKRKTPDLVHKFASKLGARLVNPKEDMRTDEKRRMTREFNAKNDHENDALASALSAYKREIVIRNRAGIRNAIAGLIPKEPVAESHAGNVSSARQIPNSGYSEIANKVRMYEREIYFLRKYISRLKSMPVQKKEHNNKININRKIDELFKFKEQRLKSYSNSLRGKDAEIALLRREIRDLNGIILNSGNFCILKKMRNLGRTEFENRRLILNINKGDVLFVEDPNIASDEVVNELNDKISIIVHKMPISRKAEKLLGFTLVSADRIAINDYGYFAAVRKENLDKEADRKGALVRIIENYRKEKATALAAHHN